MLLRTLTAHQLTSQILTEARKLGADLAGVADLAELRDSPSHRFAPRLNAEETAVWPEGGESAVVVALAHPEDRPELDWWCGDQSPRGNRELMAIMHRLTHWIEERGARTHHLPYHVQRGGIFLKDAAVLAGLGTLGKNNLLITPEYGPRVRLRAAIIEQPLIPTGPREFDPCSRCAGECRKHCPREAFHTSVHPADRNGLSALPARDGSYGRARCLRQMEADERAAERQSDPNGDSTRVIKHCRICELSCAVGKP